MQISEYTSPEIWPFGGTSGTMRTYADATFVDVEGKIIWVGIPNQTDTPCYETPFTVDGRRIALPVVDFPDTTVSPTVPQVRWTSVLYDESDTPRIYFLGGPYTTPAWLASPTTWDQIAVANAGQNITWPTPYYLSAGEVAALIAAAVTGANAPAMTTLIRGQGKLNIPATDSANPIVAGANTPIIIGTDGIKAIANYANLADAVSTIGSEETELYINSPIVSSSTTVPDTLTLQFVGDGSITVNSGQTVTISSKPNLIPGKQYFFGDGSVVFGSDAANVGVDLGWWAQDGDDATQGLADAIASIDNCSGGVVMLPAGTFTLTDTLSVPSGVTIRGQGHTYDSSPSVTTLQMAVAHVTPVFQAEGAFRNITFENFRINGTTHNGQIGILATGASPDSAFGLAVTNVVFNNLEVGIDYLSTGGDWQLEDFDITGCEFYNNTIGVRANSINSSLTWTGGNVAVPASGTGFLATTVGETLLNSVKFGGAGTAIRTAGPLTSFVILSCENEGNDFFLINTLSDTAVAITFIGGYIQSPIKISATVNVDLFGTALNAAGLFIIDLGAAPSVYAIGCPGWPACLTDNSGGTAIFPLTTSRTAVDIARQLTVASEDPDTTLPIIRSGSAVALKKFLRIGQWNATTKAFVNYYDFLRDADGYLAIIGNQASPNNGYSLSGPLQFTNDASAIAPAGSKARLNWTGSFFQLMLAATTYNILLASSGLTAGRYMRAASNGVLENGLLTDNGTNLQLISGLFQFLGTSSSFPALKRVSTGLAVRLADDSADAPVSASTGTFSTSISVNGGAALTSTDASGTGLLVKQTSPTLVSPTLGDAVASSVSISAANGGGTISAQRLAVTASVDLNTSAKTNLYTVPTGKTLIPLFFIVRNASASATTASFGLGFNASANDVVASATHTSITGSTVYEIIYPAAGAVKGNAADVLGLKCSIVEGSALTVTVETWGLIF